VFSSPGLVTIRIRMRGDSSHEMMNPRFHLRLPHLSPGNSTRFSVTRTPAPLPSRLTPWGIWEGMGCTCSPLALLSQGKKKGEWSAGCCPKEAIDNYASVARDTEGKEMGLPFLAGDEIIMPRSPWQRHWSMRGYHDILRKMPALVFSEAITLGVLPPPWIRFHILS
jgi:hypothetical protein